MDTHPEDLHCIYCREIRPLSALDPFLFPETYRCLRCGHVQRPTEVDPDSTLEVDDNHSDEEDLPYG